MKKWYQSKTLWVAVAQAITGILVVIMSENPELKGVGALGIVKSGVDIWLRTVTREALE